LEFISNAEISYPRSEVKRFEVPDDKVSWSEQYPSYNPVSYTDPKVLTAPWADPIMGNTFNPRFNELDGKIDRRSHAGKYEVINGTPRNPIGRTGIIGRGCLGRWGPNHAADPIVTRWKRDNNGKVVIHSKSKKPVLQFVSILRGDCKEWAIPGGMVDPGEQVSATLKREFGEEALNTTQVTEKEKHKLEKSIEILFSGGNDVYHGYVDDPRNTDNAWMETVAVNFHDDSGDSVGKIQLTAGDDAVGVQWKDVDSSFKLYASHKHFIATVANFLNAHF